MDIFADRMGRHWASIERAMKIANRNPAFRPQVELLLNNYFDFIDSMAVELVRRHVYRTLKNKIPSKLGPGRLPI
jgi:hypothetical protein